MIVCPSIEVVEFVMDISYSPSLSPEKLKILFTKSDGEYFSDAQTLKRLITTIQNSAVKQGCGRNLFVRVDSFILSSWLIDCTFWYDFLREFTNMHARILIQIICFTKTTNYVYWQWNRERKWVQFVFHCEEFLVLKKAKRED